ncbi:MAG TPA: response regulator [Pyrinomonadaceae bacterium]|nr:response regulator [Pyrinomonadaceae bacterium]
MTAFKGRILCTEDDPDTRELIKLTLELASYEVICSDDPEKTLELLKTESFDLCLMDNWMPGISGEDLCKKIRAFDAKTPILFYSGAAYDSDKARARDAGAQGYLVKPVRESELLAEVVRIIAEAKVAFPVAIVPPDQVEPIKPDEDLT